MLAPLTWQVPVNAIGNTFPMGHSFWMSDTSAPAIRRKAGFHHGDLREALIAATRRLIETRGPENFSLADACRLAGVSTAAPYKHFRDKQEILQEIVEQGFDELARRTREAVESAGVGTLAGITAMGRAYVAFAVEETAVFRLMFGQNRAVREDPDVETCGRACFQGVIDQVELYCSRHHAAGDAHRIALQLWTLVHGASCLLIERDYDKVAPGLDVDPMIADAAQRILAAQ
jgi:AcrR family transcriptional regulator